MPTLGSLPTDNADLELKFAWPLNPAAYDTRKVAGLTTVSVEEVRGGAPLRLQGGALVLVTGSVSNRVNGSTMEALEALLYRMAERQAAALVVTAHAEAHQVYPQSLRDLADQLSMPLLVTSAPPEAWDGVHEGIRHCRMMYAERQAGHLDLLMQQLPAKFSDTKAMQRIADWLSDVLDAQVLVSEPGRVLAASPATAAEHLAQAVIQQSVGGSGVDCASAPHTQLISLAPGTGAETVLAVASIAPYDEADIRLIRHAARLLGLVDQARREYRAATYASLTARRVTMQLLMEGETDKARRVMAGLSPGLLDTDVVRVFVMRAAPAERDVAVRLCETATAARALVVDDERDAGRLLVVHPVPPGEEGDNSVASELTRIVGALGPGASLGGSDLYSLALLAEAHREAVTAQRFAAHQPGSVALSTRSTDFVCLLPADDAQRWARRRLRPVMQSHDQWDQIRETLPTALAYPYTVAARRLNLHRNTVARRMSRAADLLNVNFGTVSHRAAVSLALELVSRSEPLPLQETGPAPTLHSLLSSCEMSDWAQALLRHAHHDRRGLLTTAAEWLKCDAHTEPAAKALGLSEVTVRAHLRALETLTSRDLGSLAGIRDLHFALHIFTGAPEIASCDPVLCVAA
ncbi:helix-turn-helix domain-containing protein [Streptomyces sp. NPDC060064]|uniref:helix-turn-helix domain-containing protein n=1 Tax=Streptomyces sp. NPDC060064 TaxID=3347049 RepID=UPI0036BC64E6